MKSKRLLIYLLAVFSVAVCLSACKKEMPPGPVPLPPDTVKGSENLPHPN